MRLADLRQVEAIAAGYPSRERFLTELTLDPPGATSDEAGAPLKDEDYLILSTISQRNCAGCGRSVREKIGRLILAAAISVAAALNHIQ